MRTKKFTIIAQPKSSKPECSVYVNLMVNTPKQAEQRFMRKIGDFMTGYWLVSVYNGDDVTREFKINTPPKMQRNHKSPVGTIDVNGKQFTAKYRITDNDGHYSYWHGKGHRPVLFQRFLKEGGNLDDLKIGY